MIKLNRLAPKDGALIFVKYEGVNIGGSIKTRTAYNMLKRAWEKCVIKNSIIVEPTSYKKGIAL